VGLAPLDPPYNILREIAMTLSRRHFLKSSLVALAPTVVPGFLGRTAAQAPAADQPGARDTILVVVQLTGGNDGLNTVIPYRDENYARLRPTLKQSPSEIRRVNDSIGLHPAMNGLADLLQDNALCIVQGVGYPNPTQSHFVSMDIWQSATTAEEKPDGWIGRALRSVPGAVSFHLANQNEVAPLALGGAPVRVPSITTLEDFQLRVNGASRGDTRQQRQLIEAAAQAPAPGAADLLDFVRQTANNTYASSRRLQEIGRSYQPRVTYPNTALANHLKLAAQLIDGGLGARLFYVSIDGFDTHAAQAPAHAALLREVSDAMTAFYRDMAARGQQNRILMMTFSEFGRRARENGSLGTDHGSAAPMLLVGGRVKAGLVGAHPSLTELEAGNLRHHTDFRQVYAAVLENWLGVPSRPVLGQAYRPVDVLRA
jgi:uncharacterized protein (DUF1501 family)